MSQNCLVIMHTINQIMTLNHYLIAMTLIQPTIAILLHFIFNTIAFNLLLYCIFQWKKCGIRMHFAIIAISFIKLTIICISFHAAKGPFALLYEIFLGMLLCSSVCTIFVEVQWVCLKF